MCLRTSVPEGTRLLLRSAYLHNYQAKCGCCMIDIDINDTIIMSYLANYMKHIQSKSGTGKRSTADNPITFSICIDASKLAEKLCQDNYHHVIVGGAYKPVTIIILFRLKMRMVPNHLMLLQGNFHGLSMNMKKIQKIRGKQTSR